MADAFDTASSDIEQQRRAAVAAIAQGGTAGAAAFQQAQEQIAGARMASLNAAAADSAARGITPAQQAEFAGTIGRPYDLLNATAAASAASHAAQMAGTGASADNYFRQVGAAIPLARTSLAQTIAAEQAKQKELSDSELRLRLMGAGEGQRGDALEDARRLGEEARSGLTEAEKAYRDFASSLKYGSTSNRGSTGAAGPLGPQGPANKKGVSVQSQNISKQDLDTLSQLAQNVVKARQARKGTKVGIADVKAKPLEAYAREVGLGGGLDENRVRGLLPLDEAADVKPATRVLGVYDAAKAAGLSQQDVEKITTPTADGSSWYEIASGEAENAIQKGYSLDRFVQDMDAAMPKKAKRVKALILARYGAAFGK